ncbi:beta-alanine-activating enzyme isoform X3 [Sitophilus oryzae]|uniref:Beta-alanine-activating enzyme isoform X3 n=1 Tax=Sitophilus oryzae TaxID=7048 RepID=A0A6J2Y5L9_SITOR|nr:beta-alanine-activating enzyme isoform X3 [Sitophilus oryzae]
MENSPCEKMNISKTIFTSSSCQKKTALILCDQNCVLQKLTFEDVNVLSEKIQTFLCEHIKERDICVGLVMDKNIYIPPIILSFQKLNFCFVFMTQNVCKNTVQNLNIKWILSFDINVEFSVLEDKIILKDNELKLWRCTLDNGDFKILNFKNMFCVIQTSGSTGDSKTIRVPYSCIRSNVISLNKHFNIIDSDVIYWGTPLTFDPSLVELLLSLFHHATLLVVPKLVALNPNYLYRALFQVGCITFLQVVPSLLFRFSHEHIANMLQSLTLKILALGGEPFPLELLEYKINKALKIFNLYGISELSCWASIFQVPHYFNRDNYIPLGDPLDETIIELFSENGQKIENGIGEIYIGSLIKHTFVQLGGTSLAAIQVLSELQYKLDTDNLGEFATVLFNNSIEACLLYLKNMKLKQRRLNKLEPLQKKSNSGILNCDNYIIWKYDLKGCVDSSPVVFKKRESVYIAVGSFSNIFTITREDGTLYFKFVFPAEIEAKPSISPCKKFIVIACGNGIIYCIDLEKKQIIWDYTTRDKTRSSPCIVGTSVIFASYDNFVYSASIYNGNLIWKTELCGGVRADLIFNSQSSIIYTGTIKGNCYSLTEQGVINWSYKINGPVFGSPCITEHGIIWASVTGTVYCISSAGDLNWKFETGTNIFSSLVFVENALYFTAHDSCLYRLIFRENQCEISEKIKLDGEISTTPFPYRYENTLYAVCISNMGVLHIINLSTSDIMFRCSLPSESFSSPFVFNNRIYVGCRDNNLYCIDFKKAIKCKI